VPAKARRPRFTAKYKQKILREADQCWKSSEIDALLRRRDRHAAPERFS